MIQVRLPWPPPIEFLRECFSLNIYDGILTWKIRPLSHFATDKAGKIWNTKHSGKVAGCHRGHGYLGVCLGDKTVSVHKVVFAIFNGYWPNGIIDHIDGEKTNNAPSNLRETDTVGNARNQKLSSRNKTGYPGIQLRKRKDGRKDRYVVCIGVNNSVRHIGQFATIEEAISARKQAEAELSFHLNHGRLS